ncbi:MAG: short-chain dehydrogenase [Gammaproteobacteria bacterium]|nr:short-chain dehydrogenase [Gammaproteobacteria bacterium]|tara:strand:+ start:161 stop:853 length:693 start_codon:yes stop_codon:yes gene_type:complete
MSTILVTGANRGIGFEFVQQYLAMGEQVIATYRNEKNSDQLISLCRDESNLEIFKLDVAFDSSMEEFGQGLGDQPIDVFINNAGIYGPRDSVFGKVDEADWLSVLRINALAPLFLTQLLIENLRRGELKKLVYVTSKMGSIEDNRGGGSYVYRSSKAALNAVVKSISVDLESEKMAVAVLHPGWVRTDMGGPNGLIDTKTSVAGMVQVIRNLNVESSGAFFNYDGNVIPW